MRVDLAASLQHHNHKRGTTIDDDDRPHHHVEYPDIVVELDSAYINYDHLCTNDYLCLNLNPVVVVALDDYRALVAAARDRHPTNQQRGTDPAAYIASFDYPPIIDSW